MKVFPIFVSRRLMALGLALWSHVACKGVASESALKVVSVGSQDRFRHAFALLPVSEKEAPNAQSLKFGVIDCLDVEGFPAKDLLGDLESEALVGGLRVDSNRMVFRRKLGSLELEPVRNCVIRNQKPYEPQVINAALDMAYAATENQGALRLSQSVYLALRGDLAQASNGPAWGLQALVTANRAQGFGGLAMPDFVAYLTERDRDLNPCVAASGKWGEQKQKFYGCDQAEGTNRSYAARPALGSAHDVLSWIVGNLDAVADGHRTTKEEGMALTSTPARSDPGKPKSDNSKSKTSTNKKNITFLPSAEVETRRKAYEEVANAQPTTLLGRQAATQASILKGFLEGAQTGTIKRDAAMPESSGFTRYSGTVKSDGRDVPVTVFTNTKGETQIWSQSRTNSDAAGTSTATYVLNGSASKSYGDAGVTQTVRQEQGKDPVHTFDVVLPEIPDPANPKSGASAMGGAFQIHGKVENGVFKPDGENLKLFQAQAAKNINGLQTRLNQFDGAGNDGGVPKQLDKFFDGKASYTDAEFEQAVKEYEEGRTKFEDAISRTRDFASTFGQFKEHKAESPKETPSFDRSADSHTDVTPSPDSRPRDRALEQDPFPRETVETNGKGESARDGVMDDTHGKDQGFGEMPNEAAPGEAFGEATIDPET